MIAVTDGLVTLTSFAQFLQHCSLHTSYSPSTSVSRESDMHSRENGEVPSGAQTAADYVEKVHADGTMDRIDAKAIGGDVDDMPAGYFYCAEFLGTLVVCWLLVYQGN